MNQQKKLKICFMGSRQAGIIGALTVLSRGNNMLSAVSYSENLTTILNLCGISVYNTVNHKDFVRTLRESEVLLSVHGREIVGPALLRLPKRACINIHPYLYKYKGAKPVERALKDGEFRASVGAHIMEGETDAGSVLIEEFVDVSGTSTVEETYNLLYPYYSIVVLKVLDIICDRYKK